MELKEQLSGKRVYFDTNIVIYLVEGLIEYQSILDDLQELLSANDCEAVTSELTLCEALIRPFKIGSPEGITIYRSFLEKSGVFDLAAPSRNILVQTAFVAGTTAMKTPDTIHIATALESKCEVMLTNDKKMKTITDLEKILWLFMDSGLLWRAPTERHDLVEPERRWLKSMFAREPSVCAIRAAATALYPCRRRLDSGLAWRGHQATRIQSGVGSVPVAGPGLPTRHRRGSGAQGVMFCRRTPKGGRPMVAPGLRPSRQLLACHGFIIREPGGYSRFRGCLSVSG